MKIILTESQYNLLLEADRRSIIIDKLGFSQEWADEFHNLSDKYSIWIAVTFLKIKKVHNVDVINETPPNEYNTWPGRGNYKSRYQYILDWLRSPRREQVDLKTLTYDQAFLEADEWHKNLTRKSEENYKEKNEIIIDYRNDKGVGYYWANLGVPYSKEECDRMGHCGRGRGQLFSLRSINDFGEGQSYLTADYNKGVVGDFKASGNEHPSKKYYKYIIDLLVQRKYPIQELSKIGYRYETNFKLSDLDESQMKYVLDHNRALKYDINNKSAWPFIIEGIVNKEIFLDSYTYDIRLKLLKFSNDNEVIVSEMLEDAPSRDINDQIELLRSLKKKDDIIRIIRETTRPLHNLDNLISANHVTYFQFFVEDVKLTIQNEIERRSDVSGFIGILRLIGNTYPEYIDKLCDVLSKGFLKFSSQKDNFILNPRINRDIFKCAPNIEPKELYTYVSEPDLKGYITVKSGNGLFGIVDKQNNYIIEPTYTELSYAGSNVYVGKTINGEYVTINSNGTIEPFNIRKRPGRL